MQHDHQDKRIVFTTIILSVLSALVFILTRSFSLSIAAFFKPVYLLKIIRLFFFSASKANSSTPIFSSLIFFSSYAFFSICLEFLIWYWFLFSFFSVLIFLGLWESKSACWYLWQDDLTSFIDLFYIIKNQSLDNQNLFLQKPVSTAICS